MSLWKNMAGDVSLPPLASCAFNLPSLWHVDKCNGKEVIAGNYLEDRLDF
jgi:hypothetical protein